MYVCCNKTPKYTEKNAFVPPFGPKLLILPNNYFTDLRLCKGNQIDPTVAHQCDQHTEMKYWIDFRLP